MTCDHPGLVQSPFLFCFFPFSPLSLLSGASLVAQRLKRLPAVQETQVRSLSWEDPLDPLHAKSLQLCPTLCNPVAIACQAPLSVGILQVWILQARRLEWVAISFLAPCRILSIANIFLYPIFYKV